MSSRPILAPRGGANSHKWLTRGSSIVLFISQVGYVVQLFSSDLEKVNPACAVGSHFIANNLLHFAFVMLFVRSHFVWAELILIINFFNLSSLAFRHHAYPRFIHTPVVSGPLAWTFVAICKWRCRVKALLSVPWIVWDGVLGNVLDALFSAALPPACETSQTGHHQRPPA